MAKGNNGNGYICTENDELDGILLKIIKEREAEVKAINDALAAEATEADEPAEPEPAAAVIEETKEEE